MSSGLLNDLGTTLRQNQYAQTSFEELGLVFDEERATELALLAQANAHRMPSFEGVLRESRGSLQICGDMARAFMQPIIDVLFCPDKYPDDVRSGWSFFGLNVYEFGDIFPPHRDFNNPEISTTVIASLTGIRQMRLTDINARINQVPGSVVLLDGAANPLHSVACISDTSVSVVADIRELLR